MRDLGSKASKRQRLNGKARSALPAILFGLGLAGCSHPAPVVVAAPPPPPVGHPYQTLAQVPPTTRRMTPEQIQDTQQAFNVIALKSALMVAALTCDQQTQYDQFMTTFQPHILAAQHVMDAYFKRMGGYYGQAREDEFVTLLANNQSVGGIGQGGMFCLNNAAEFQQVLALKSDSALDNFVTDQSPDPSDPFAPVMVASDTPHYYSHYYSHSAKRLYVAHPTATAAVAHPAATAKVATAAAAHSVVTATATPAKPVSMAAADPQ